LIAILHELIGRSVNDPAADRFLEAPGRERT
jgi:hypothetical protein